jgi:uncharacterized cupin superfamily protein
MSGGMHPIVNLDALKFERTLEHGERFSATIAPVGPRIGARKLGYNVTRVAPGKRAFPFHSHHVGEEMFFVLEGQGVLRFGSTEHAVREGDFVACPSGGPEVAHQFVNTGAADLVYIAVSSRHEADVWEYPDSGKFGAMAGVDLASGWPPKASFPSRFMRDGEDVDYWEGE